MYTKREAAAALGIDRNTLDKWLTVCGITPKRDPRDTRLRLLSDDDVLRLREHYAESHRAFNGASVHLSVSSADLAARVAALEATIEQLRQRAPYLFGAPTEARVATDVQLPPYAPPRRQIVATDAHKGTSKRAPIPEGMLHQNGWARLHHLAETTVKTHIKDEGVPLEHGEWIDGTTPVKHLLAAEGQAMLHRIFHLGDPCADCGWSSANETTPTHAVVEVARDLG